MQGSDFALRCICAIMQTTDFKTNFKVCTHFVTQGQRRDCAINKYQGSEKYVVVGSEEEEGYQIRVFKCYLVEQ